MENSVFPKPAVAGLLMESFVEARLHNDHDTLGEAISAQQEALVRTLATPSYAILDPRTREQLVQPLSGLISTSDFAEWLAEALRSWKLAKQP